MSDLPAILAFVAADLEEEHPGYRYTGPIRQGARALREAERALAATEIAASACPCCGRAVSQPHTGRPRKFCTTRCRRRAYDDGPLDRPGRVAPRSDAGGVPVSSRLANGGRAGRRTIESAGHLVGAARFTWRPLKLVI